MAAWQEDEIYRIAEADDLHISPLRDNGVTYGTPTWTGPLRHGQGCAAGG